MVHRDPAFAVRGAVAPVGAVGVHAQQGAAYRGPELGPGLCPGGGQHPVLDLAGLLGAQDGEQFAQHPGLAGVDGAGLPGGQGVGQGAGQDDRLGQFGAGRGAADPEGEAEFIRGPTARPRWGGGR